MLEEFLTDAYVMQDYRDISFWTRDRIDALRARLLGDPFRVLRHYDALVGEGWLGTTLDAATMPALTPLWSAYAEKLRHFVGGLFDAAYLDVHRRWIGTLPDWWGRIDALPKTLIYNDAQIRNLAVREPGNAPRLVLFDWECTSIQLPQRDLVEFLSYAISDRISDAEIIGAARCGAHRARAAQRTADRRARVARRMPPVDPGSAREPDGLPARPAHHAQPARHRARLPRLDAHPALAGIIALAPARPR